jgi:hypothetical protein
VPFPNQAPAFFRLSAARRPPKATCEYVADVGCEGAANLIAPLHHVRSGADMIDPFAPWLFTGLVLAQGVWISLKLVRTSDLALAGLALVTALAMAIYVLAVGR